MYQPGKESNKFKISASFVTKEENYNLYVKLNFEDPMQNLKKS